MSWCHHVLRVGRKLLYQDELTIHKEHVEAPLWGRPAAPDLQGLTGERLTFWFEGCPWLIGKIQLTSQDSMRIVVYHLNSSTLTVIIPTIWKKMTIKPCTYSIYIYIYISISIKSSESSIVPRISLEMCTISLSTAAAMPWKSALQTSRPGNTAEPRCKVQMFVSLADQFPNKTKRWFTYIIYTYIYTCIYIYIIICIYIYMPKIYMIS